MFPSIYATSSDGSTAPDLVIFREFAATVYPRSKNAFTRPAPMPCEPPVTIAVFRSPLMVAYRKRLVTSEIRVQHDAVTSLARGCHRLRELRKCPDRLPERCP